MISYLILEFILLLGNILTLNQDPTRYISTQKYINSLDFINDKKIILDNLEYNSIIFAKDFIPNNVSDFIIFSNKYKNIIFISFYKDEINYRLSSKLIDSLKKNISNESTNISYHSISFLTQGINDGYILYVLYN
jgi:hypothetical protein